MHFANQGSLPTIKSMIKAGDLNPLFETGIKGNYKFDIQSGPKGGPVIYADPIEDHPELSHYMADEWGSVRVERDKRAGPKSVIYET